MESWLVSFPPLIDMLKFSGCSPLSSGRKCKGFSWFEGRPKSQANTYVCSSDANYLDAAHNGP
jgi:hypothetical protein